METESKDLGAVVVAGNVKYEVLEDGAGRVKLRNILEPDQYVLIDFEALHAIATILKRVAADSDVNKLR